MEKLSFQKLKNSLYLTPNSAIMKLPKPTKRGDSWRIEFMLNGKRVRQNDIDKILIVCDYTINTKPTTQRHYVAWCFLFAIETAMMRAGEIISMQWKNVFHDHVHLPKTKNGTERNVPLLHSASDLLELMRGIDDTQVRRSNLTCFPRPKFFGISPFLSHTLIVFSDTSNIKVVSGMPISFESFS